MNKTTEEQFAQEALEIIHSATELTHEEYIEAIKWETKNSMWSQCHIGDLLMGVRSSNRGFKNNPDFVGLIDVSEGGSVRLNERGAKFAKFVMGLLN